MNDESTSMRRERHEANARRVMVIALGCMTGLSFVLAMLEVKGVPEPDFLRIGPTLVFATLSFAWFWFDSEARGYARSPWLMVAIIGVSIVAIPYYLARSRPPRERMKAIGRMLGFCGLLVVASIVGALPAALRP